MINENLMILMFFPARSRLKGFKYKLGWFRLIFYLQLNQFYQKSVLSGNYNKQYSFQLCTISVFYVKLIFKFFIEIVSCEILACTFQDWVHSIVPNSNNIYLCNDPNKGGYEITWNLPFKLNINALIFGKCNLAERRILCKLQPLVCAVLL